MKNVPLEGAELEALYLHHKKQFFLEYKAGNLAQSQYHEERANQLKEINEGH